MRLALACTFAIAATAWWGAPARADSTDAGIAAGYTRSGDAAYALGHYEEALDAYRSAAHLVASAELDYDIGRCNDRLGRGAEAVQAYQRYLHDEGPAPAHAGEVNARLAALRESTTTHAPRVQPAAIVVGVVAVAAVAIGAGIYTSAADDYDSLHTSCAHVTCTSGDYRGAEQRDIAGKALFGVAGVGLAVDVALWVLWAHERRALRQKH